MTTLFLNDGRAFYNAHTLPAPGRAYQGMWQNYEGGLLFQAISGKPIAQLVNNGRCPPFFVSATRTPEGKLFFMQGLCSSDAEWLGIPESSRARDALVHRLIEDTSPVPAIAIMRRELHRQSGTVDVWEIAECTQWLSLGVDRAACDTDLERALCDRLQAAGVDDTPVNWAQLAAPRGTIAVLEESSSVRVTIEFDRASDPAARYHGAIEEWRASHLDLAARVRDWRAECEPSNPPPAPAVGMRF